jgi:hypothetical protein
MISKCANDERAPANTCGQAELVNRPAGRLLTAPQEVPRTVIRGESFSESPNPSPLPSCGDITPDECSHPFSAHTDWLNCTIPITGDSEFLSDFIYQFFFIAGDQFAPMTECSGGLRGWKQSFSLGETRAKLAVGVQNNTIFLSLPGEACTQIPMDAMTMKVNTLWTGQSSNTKVISSTQVVTNQVVDRMVTGSNLMAVGGRFMWVSEKTAN